MGYLTFTEQRRHYLDRAETGSSLGPVGGPMAWTADELAEDPTWIVQLAGLDLHDLDAALDVVMGSGVPLHELHRADVDLGRCARSVQEWSRKLAEERGIVLVRGFPVERWGEERTAVATWCLGLHLGTPGAQNPRGDLLGHVRNLPAVEGAEHRRLYQTDADIRFHCDYADVVGLMCLRPARVGGESRVASSIAVHDALWRSDPVSACRLYRPVWLDSRDEGPEPAVRVTPFAFDGERVRIFYHSDYFRSVERHGARFQLDDELTTALDRFDALASSPELCVPMRLEAGDLQLVSNHAVVHARTTYEDDPGAPRHLLRLWLSAA